MPRFIPQRQEDILAAMLPRVVVQGGFTDITDSSSVMSLLTAVASACDQANYQMFLLLSAFSIDTAEGSDLDMRAAEIGGGGLVRRSATAATGTVIFSRNSGAGTVNIAVGAQVTTTDGTQVYTTTAVGQVTDATSASVTGHSVGQDSSAVPIAAVTAGAAGNVGTGVVASFVSRPTGVDSVINLSATTGGQDQETDDAFRGRIQAYVASLARATPSSLVGAVLGQTDPASGRTITFASVVEDAVVPGVVTLLIDDGTGAAATSASVTGETLTQGLSGPPVNAAVGGERRFYCQNVPIQDEAPIQVNSSSRGVLVKDTDYAVTASTGQIMLPVGLAQAEVLTINYTYYTGLIALAQSIINGSETTPGYRGAGIKVMVRTPQIVTTAIVTSLTVSNGYDVATVDTAVVSAVTGYINTLGIGADIQRASLIQNVMNVPGVTNVVLGSPQNDVIVLDDQIARVAASNVTVS